MDRVWQECPGYRRIHGSCEAEIWTLLLLCLKGEPGLTGNGWVNVLRLQKERRCNQHPGGVSNPRRCGAGSKASGMGRRYDSIFPRVAATMEKGAFPTQPDPAFDGKPALCRPHRFTNTAVPQFDGTVCGNSINKILMP